MDIMQLCRLCLVKDQVNIPIFGEQGDIRQIFLKITACLPVKVSKEDNLPKKICDGCLYKLELLYQFWNTTVNAEKQLLEWLNQAGLDANKKATDGAMAVVNDVQDAADLVLKEEAIDITEVRGDEEDDLSTEANSYILQQQQLPYQTFEYQQDGTKPSDDSIAAAAEETTQPPAKRQKVSAAPAQTIVNPETESDDDIDTTEMKLTKVEDNSDGENPEPTTFVGVDNEQPGPSGVGKTAEAPSGSLQCDMCNKEYPNKRCLQAHKSRTHTNKTRIPCEICDRSFKDKSGMKRHLELMHSQHDFSYECTICNKKFKHSSYLQIHSKTHEPCEYNYQCGECQKRFRTKSNLKWHYDGVHGGFSYTCDVCNRSFNNKHNMLSHKETHVPEHLRMKKFECEKCGQKFTRQDERKSHISKKHEKLKPCLCVVCGKSLSGRHSLRDHMNIHSGVKPHACDICGRSFAKKSTLTQHKVVHTKEKPFKCEVCGKRFTQRAPLSIHIRHVHKKETPHQCKICKKSFVLQAQLNTHLKTHGVCEMEKTEFM